MREVLDIGNQAHLNKKQLITHNYWKMGKPHAQRKQEIIQSALELAAEQGVKKVTTQAIADRVGIAQPTVFRHFKTRDDIFADAIAWLADKLFSVIGVALDERLPADQRLKRLIETQLDFVSRHRGLPRMLFSDRLHLESPILKKTVQRVMGKYTSQVADLIRAGTESGCFDQSLDPDESARFVAATIQGLIMRWSIFDFSFRLADESDALWTFIHAALKRRK